MKEKDAQSLFKANIDQIMSRINARYGTETARSNVFELKIAKGPSIAFDSVKVHQIEGLLKASLPGKYLYHKISDMPVSWGMESRLRFTKPKPFDCMVLSGCRAFVVIFWYTPRRKKEFHFIEIGEYLKALKESSLRNKKSLKYEMSLVISSIIINLCKSET